ncbi:hypothetical protein QHH03_06450, partial [Aphanizomenon sp. 202]|nr:hypothetical protein [Aphanizomenon sp. 202]
RPAPQETFGDFFNWKSLSRLWLLALTFISGWGLPALDKVSHPPFLATVMNQNSTNQKFP